MVPSAVLRVPPTDGSTTSVTGSTRVGVGAAGATSLSVCSRVTRVVAGASAAAGALGPALADGSGIAAGAGAGPATKIGAPELARPPKLPNPAELEPPPELELPPPEWLLPPPPPPLPPPLDWAGVGVGSGVAGTAATCGAIVKASARTVDLLPA